MSIETITVQHRVPEELRAYVEMNARVRHISQTQLLRMVMKYVLQDKLILSILDDGDAPSPKTAFKRNTRNVLRPEPVKKVLQQVREQPHRVPNRQTINIGRPQPKTREQLRRELAEAAANTAAMSVDE